MAIQMHNMRIRNRRHAARLALAASLMIALACDQGTEPHDHGQNPDGTFCGHVEAAGIVLTSHSINVARQQNGAPDPNYPNKVTVRAGGQFHGIDVVFIGERGEEIRVAPDCTENTLGWEIANPAVARITQDPPNRWWFNVEGLQPGTTTFTLWPDHDGHNHYVTLPITIEVTTP